MQQNEVMRGEKMFMKADQEKHEELLDGLVSKTYKLVFTKVMSTAVGQGWGDQITI